MPRLRKFTDEQLTEAVKTSTNWSEVCRKTPGSLWGLKTRADYLGLDTSHFVGQSWNKGRRYRPHILEMLGPNTRIKSLFRYLIEDGVKQRQCEHCGITEWQGRPAPLEIDHINGDNTDNRLENLQILCCNCHALTPTWRRRKSSIARVGHLESRQV